MIPIDEMEIMLDEITAELPKDFFNALNGGIVLLPEQKLHPKSVGNDLYILGEYNHGGVFGRYIAIYYGSFERVYGHFSKAGLKEQLKSTIKHEFLHHLESMAGEKGLEIKDARDIQNYLKGK